MDAIIEDEEFIANEDHEEQLERIPQSSPSGEGNHGAGNTPDPPEGLHPSSLEQQNPWIISQVFFTGTGLIANYGWYVLCILVICAVLWMRYKHKIYKWLEKREQSIEAAEYHKNPDKFLAREQAIETARRRLQERYEDDKDKHMIRMAELEEKKRQERLEEFDRLDRGEGYYSKSRFKTASTTTPRTTNQASTSTSKTESKGKAKLRPEYNPMLGDTTGGSSSYRPTQRGGSGGG